ncbi:MAG: hypothetical protein JXR88_17775 [Clostridia bacterium]|nr:hypothetical protein [Clostridia bacterium]
MKLNQNILALLLIVVILGGYLLINNMNLFTDEKTPTRYEDGTYDPSSIRGSFTFSEISEFFHIPIDTLSEAFGLSNYPDMENTKSGDLSGIYDGLLGDAEIGNGSVQFFVAAYLGLPIELNEDTYLFKSAVDILLNEGTPTEEQKAYMARFTMDNVLMVFDEETLTTIEENHELEEESTLIIKGNTTFSEIMTWGITEEEIISIVGEMPNQILSVRDYCESHDLTFSTIKKSLEALLSE